jgi:hypothetical protein
MFFFVVFVDGRRDHGRRGQGQPLHLVYHGDGVHQLLQMFQRYQRHNGNNNNTNNKNTANPSTSEFDFPLLRMISSEDL